MCPKWVFHYLPLKPLFKFLFACFLQQGFRGGYRGYMYAMMESFYVFASYAKLWELCNGLVSSEEYQHRR